MKKLALVVPSLNNSGGVQAVARFIKNAALNSGKYEVKIISLCMSSDDQYSLHLRSPLSWFKGVRIKEGVWDGLPYYHVGALFGELEFQRYQKRKILDELLFDCDVIQVVCGSAAWANVVTGLGKPVALQVATRAKIERRHRDLRPWSLLGLWRKVMTEITDHLDDKALQTVDAIEVENEWMFDYSRTVNRDRIDVDIRYAPPGVNTMLFHPLEQRTSLANPYILCVGRLADPRKNINLLLKAFALLPDSLSHIHLITAGSGQPAADYWALVDVMGLKDRVHHVLRPEIDELISLYQQAAVFSLTSDEEGLGVVILEAMACGIPVVSTRSGGPEGIITDGKDGYLVPLDDATALAERLSKICLDFRLNQKMGREAREKIELRYADEVASRAFVDIWDNLLKRSKNN